jgi:hypothetical protein
LARPGRSDEATATAELLSRAESRRGDNPLAAAEIYAILALGVKPAIAPGGDSPDNNPEPESTVVEPPTATLSSDESNRFRKLRDGYAARAVKLLRDAADAGFLGDAKKPSTELLANSNLAALVGRDDFQSLLSGLDLAAAEKVKKPK